MGLWYGSGRRIIHVHNRQLKILVISVACSVATTLGVSWFFEGTRKAKGKENTLVTSSNTSEGGPPFSKRWMNVFSSTGVGSCGGGMDLYIWRSVGLGSNLNSLLATWVAAIMKGRTGVAASLRPQRLGNLTCSSESGGKVNDGWGCLFKPMANFCTFDGEKEWKEFTRSSGVPRSHEEMTLARAKNLSFIPMERSQLNESIVALGTGMDVVKASAALLDFVLSNLQPWVEQEIESVLHWDKGAAAIRKDQYVGLHVRRGDKLVREAEKVDVSVYLETAASFLRRSSGNALSVNSITGVWVSSDDSTVLPEIQPLVRAHLPNAREEKIVSISQGASSGEPLLNQLPTSGNFMTYKEMVRLLAEIRMLSEAAVFVGTFSSNIARLVFLLRELKGFPPNTTLSVDEPTWYSGRALLSSDRERPRGPDEGT